MNYESAAKILAKNSQEHVLAFWKKLSAAERRALLAQIESIDFKSVARMQATLSRKDEPAPARKAEPVPPKVAVLKGAGLKKAVEAGENELKAGRVAVLLVAGGQGSRLGYDGPKGCFPIGPVTGEPLFYFHARKILARTLDAGAPVPFYIMTSEANRASTVQCFEDNDYFGLDPADVMFFTQGMWPGLTPEGKIILDAPGHIFMSPDGHGGTLAALKRSGALADMKKRGIKSVFFFQVDNPMVEIADPAFIGYHVLNNADYSAKLCEKRSPGEKLGMPVKCGKTYEMIEYTEMTPEMCNRKRPDGKLYYLYGSPAIHVFDREFLEREAVCDMPLHLAFKKIPMVDSSGKTLKPSAPNAYKFEKFIFDALKDAKHPAFLAFDRADEFSPVKNAEGEDSPATAKRDLQLKWRRWLAEAGLPTVEGTDLPVEIDPVYAMCAEDLKSNGIVLSADAGWAEPPPVKEPDQCKCHCKCKGKKKR